MLDGINLFQQGTLSPALQLHLCVRNHQPTEHGSSQRPAPWPFPAVPALSLTILCVHMLVDGSAASSTTGCVVEDVKTAVDAASAAAFAPNMVIARVRPYGAKKSHPCGWVCM